MIWPMMSDYEYGINQVAELRRLNHEVNELFGSSAARRSGASALNVWAGENRAIVVAAVPGLDAKDLTITMEGRLLVIEGERKAEEAAATRRERALGRFLRQVRLPFEIAADQVSAKCEHGVVTITLPRSEQSKPRKIAVVAN